MNKILAPLTVEGTEVTTQTLRNVVEKMKRLPEAFKAMDLIGAVPSKGNDIHFQQEVLNRVMQRWRRMNLVTFKKKHWAVMPGGWDKFLEAWRETENQ